MNIRGWLILSLGIVVGLLSPGFFREQAEAQGPPPGNGNLAARVALLELMVEGITGDLDTAEQERQALADDLQDAEQQIQSLSSDLQDAGQAISGLESKLASMSVVGNNVIFQGVNLVVRNAQGMTESIDGTGNLIVGYDEGSSSDDKSGSHNLVVGIAHSYSSYGGLVAGDDNCISAAFASVTGGASNKATDYAASVTGGFLNEATGPVATVSGGLENEARANGSVVSGGAFGLASGSTATVSGGLGFEANVQYSHKP